MVENKDVRPLDAGSDFNGGRVTFRIILLAGDSSEDVDGGDHGEIGSSKGVSFGEGKSNAERRRGDSADGSSTEGGHWVNGSDGDGSGENGVSGRLRLGESTGLNSGDGEGSGVDISASNESLGDSGGRVRAAGISGKGDFGEASLERGGGLNGEDEVVSGDAGDGGVELSNGGSDKGGDGGELASSGGISVTNGPSEARVAGTGGAD